MSEYDVFQENNVMKLCMYRGKKFTVRRVTQVEEAARLLSELTKTHSFILIPNKTITKENN